ncbi:ion channel [Acidomonas methanolica]|uniref:ATP-sensitive potassium transporter n=1 Tax=Acidomonas methanolica NBRC 104435 TaxID=1231351 RepID=A0A023D2N1_ACIMT|nr:ion channel [Acidomonas methanolica]MBU2654580.1 ATP-sensitive potassium channel protein [Acidomonas methanolica]TCS27453.1 inward rectifier potassium channel [Acidomonas methanolica]GAJ28066.1 ATP-sensitive potassium transporter [Acidomonas methanolica NBRC 104435]GBQ51811.1 ATP-sensitive potassium transporter [Acidomonas methanolica]GEK98640.1 inward rectifier potassium channel protein [Acidomonas methanolica NBRC 104435]
MMKTRWRRGGKGLRPPVALDPERRFHAHLIQEQSDGDVQRIGLADSIWTDIYHHLLTMSWPGFMLWSVALYFVVNFIFTLLYAATGATVGGVRPHRLDDLFFFSVQTFSTVGYGAMAPEGPTANILSTVELYVGMLVNALGTGAVFARFARPRARVIFSRHAVISSEHGMPALCVRIANCRRSALLSVGVEAALAQYVMGENGHPVRRFVPLPLLQPHIPILRFAFVLAHVIEKDSPLAEHLYKHLLGEQAEVMLTLTGTDEVTGQTMLARASYRFERIKAGHRFVDILDLREGGGIAVDYRRFHDIEEDARGKGQEARTG